MRRFKDRSASGDVDVWSFRFAGSKTVGTKLPQQARTDAEGRFRLAGFPKGHGNELLIVPNDDQPYFMQDVAVPDPPGIGAVPVEVGLHRGTWIEGKITDQETGGAGRRGLGSVISLSRQPVRSGDSRIPRRCATHRDLAGQDDRYKSKADGSYRLVGLPGSSDRRGCQLEETLSRRCWRPESIKGMNEHGHFATVSNPVTASRHFPDSMKEINPAEGTETVHLDLSLDPGAKVRLRVVDSQGKPVPGVKSERPPQRAADTRSSLRPRPRSMWLTLGPGEDRMVWLIHEGRKLGRVIHVKEERMTRTAPVVVHARTIGIDHRPDRGS